MDYHDLGCSASQHMAGTINAFTQGNSTTTSQASSPTVQDIDVTKPFTWDNGQTLRIGFSGGNDWQKDQVQRHSVEWCKYANNSLTFVIGPPYHILISFLELGSWSQLGIYSLMKIMQGQPSMNFGWMYPAVPEAERRAVTLHEFGHALGLVHEHQGPWIDYQIAWNTQKVYEFFSAPPNSWEKATIMSNILQKFKGVGLAKKAWFDIDSIMLYTYPKELFVKGDGTPRNYELSLLDKGAMFMVYPGRDMGDHKWQIELGLEGRIGRFYAREYEYKASTDEEVKGG
ncbi:hypothetical protein EK21DRAFT_90879 [Setomelanomma holmii]|uniref:Peptidase metallopeptidase domain-containing protein n=1 Tax=Setomelanomma holmii TaxID=210430 RepID=A0A9P4LJZ8_9PLEO|nr:hypothetical protein EK21DRAFT_90879 [Setomelanomma holmii]